ncbi:MAG TPA: hypothetical protein VF101_02110 [Gaiellaceae bacterium]
MHLVLSLLVAALMSAPPPPCARHVLRGPAGLPAPVVLTTSCASFTLARDGSVTAASLPPLPTTRIRTDGHVVLGAWHSARRYRLYDVVLRPGPRAIALGYHARLYFSVHGEPEREVGHGIPFAWTRRGTLVALRFRGRRTDLDVRDAAGRRLRVLARRVRSYALDPASGTLLYVDRRGTLFRSDGRLRTRLGRTLPGAWIDPLSDGLVAVLTRHRIAVLRAEGSLLGLARFAGDVAVPVAGAGGVAFTVTHGYRGYRTRGFDDVELLRADGSVVRALHRRLRFALCARGADLTWRGGWLLYHSTEGALAAIDSRTRRTIDLTRFAARLPGFDLGGEGDADLRASWAGPPAPPSM